MAGLDTEGFDPKSLETIKDEIADEVKNAIATTLNTEATSLLGQLIGAVASQLRQLWELGQALYAAHDPDQASGDALTAIAALTGTVRRAATYSTDTLTLNLDAGTYAAGSLVVHVVGDATARFANAAEVISVGGNTSVAMVAEDAGPVRANAGTLTVIASPVAGFNSVVSDPSDAVMGSDEETDSELRLRREQELTRRGSSTVDAIRTDIAAVSGVTAALVIENATDTTDGYGIGPHGIGAYVTGGTDAAVADAIWASKPAGIATYGTTTVSVTDSQGVAHDVKFSRPSASNIYLVYTLTVITDQYIGDAAFKTAIADWGDENLGVGTDVIRSKLIAVASGLGGVLDVAGLTLGTAPSPVGTSNLTIGPTNYADLDTSRITVNVTYVSAAP